jgi:uncharacterized protein DUF302
MPVSSIDGLVTRPSHHSVDATLERLKGVIQAAGATVFALVDHSAEAAKVGMTMRPTKLLIFGNPKAGTPLMLASPSIAIDLPLEDPRLGGRGRRSVVFLQLGQSGLAVEHVHLVDSLEPVEHVHGLVPSASS